MTTQRYKVGYYTDEWRMHSNTPCLIPDDSGFAVKFEDYCKLETENERLEAENERLKHNLATMTRQRDNLLAQVDLAVKALESIAGRRMFIDNLASNVDIAVMTLNAIKESEEN